jgi:hypothetical protein
MTKLGLVGYLLCFAFINKHPTSAAIGLHFYKILEAASVDEWL